MGACNVKKEIGINLYSLVAICVDDSGNLLAYGCASKDKFVFDIFKLDANNRFAKYIDLQNRLSLGDVIRCERDGYFWLGY